MTTVTPSRVAASLERCPSIVQGVIVTCDACREGRRADCIGEPPPRYGVDSDAEGPSWTATFSFRGGW